MEYLDSAVNLYSFIVTRGEYTRKLGYFLSYLREEAEDDEIQYFCSLSLAQIKNVSALFIALSWRRKNIRVEYEKRLAIHAQIRNEWWSCLRDFLRGRNIKILIIKMPNHDIRFNF